MLKTQNIVIPEAWSSQLQCSEPQGAGLLWVILAQLQH